MCLPRAWAACAVSERRQARGFDLLGFRSLVGGCGVDVTVVMLLPLLPLLLCKPYKEETVALQVAGRRSGESRYNVVLSPPVRYPVPAKD